MSKLSVIIPVYNSEEYISKCLDSIINQTFKDIEIICIDDGSTDNSLRILQEYAKNDARIKICTQENKGPAVARNLGLQKAQSKYITFVDSDDLLDIKTYSIALENIADSDMVCFGIEIFGSSHFRKRDDDENYYKIKYKGKTILNDKIKLTTDCSSCNKIFKKDIIDKYNIFYPTGLHYEDAAFYWMYISVIDSVYFVDQYLYKYRRHNNSIMTTTFDNYCQYSIDHLHIMGILYEYFCRLNIFGKNIKLFSNIFESYFWFAYNYASPKDKPDILAFGSILANKYFTKNIKSSPFIRALKARKYSNLCEGSFTFKEKIFSIKKVYDPSLRLTRKNLYFLGIRLKLQNKNRELLENLNIIKDQNEELRQTLMELTQKIYNIRKV